MNRWHAGIRRGLRTFLTAVGLLTVIVAVTPVVPWWGRGLAGSWTDPSGDTLIVLGGSMLDTGVIGESSYLRSVYAIGAYQQGGFRQIIVSGGGTSSVSIARVMADFLACHGVPPSAVRIEARSNSTRENALYTAEMLRNLPGTNVLLTSDYHMFRASRAFRKLGVNVLARPLPDAIKRGSSFQGRFGAFIDLSRETAAILYYFARGWI